MSAYLEVIRANNTSMFHKWELSWRNDRLLFMMLIEQTGC